MPVNIEFKGHFFRLGKRMYPYFKALRNGAEEEIIREMVKRDFGIHLPASEVKFFLDKIFSGSGLKIDIDGNDGETRYKISSSRHPEKCNDASMMRMRTTLISENLVCWISGKLTFFYTKLAFFSFVFLVVANIALYSSYGIPYSFVHLRTLQISGFNIWIVAPVFIFSFIFHEFGHSTASFIAGVRPGRIGFGVHWIYPVLFSDVTRAWSLQPNKRVLVDVGGIYFQGIFSAIIAAAIPFVPENISPSLSLCLTCNIIAIIFAMIPITRHDGYWAISDYLDEPHLSELPGKMLIRILSGQNIHPLPFSSKDKIKRCVLAGYIFISFACFIGFNLLLFFTLKKSAFLIMNTRY